MFSTTNLKISNAIKRRQELTFAIIAISDVANRVNDNNFFTFDCNSYNSYLRHHIPNAKYLGQMFSVAELPKNKDATLVFYSKNSQCRAAISAAKRALEVGYYNIFIMRAGISGWLYSNNLVIGRSV